MQQVQLYIGDQRIELFKDETISLTETIQNVKDIAKVFTDFTKTFSIPATKETNKLFKHYYNFDIEGGFDARTKRSGSIKLNGVDFKKGKIKLEGVDLKDNKAHTYRITFFGDLVLLKDLIGEDKLDSLTFLDNFTRDYNATEVKARLRTALNFTINGEDFNRALIAPLISCNQRLFFDSRSSNNESGNVHFSEGQVHGVRWDDLKYAIKVYAIIRAIEKKYDIEFTKNGSDDFIKNVDNTFSLWGSLYLWMHRKSGKYTNSVVEGESSYTRFVQNFEEKVVVTYTLNGHTWEFESTGDGIVNSGFGTAVGSNGKRIFPLISFSIEPIAADASKEYYVKTYNDGVLYSTTSLRSGNSTASLSPQNNSKTTVEVISSEEITFQKFEALCKMQELDEPAAASGTVDITSNFLLQGFKFYPTQQVPEMKVLDFITGFFKTFNLTAYIQDDGKIKLQTLDSFYANQSTESPYDITEFVDVNSSKVNVALPFSKVKFLFKQSKSLLAAKFNQLNNAQYGQLEYNADSAINFVGKEYKVEAPWEKMLYERLRDQSNANDRVTDSNVQIQYGLMKTENNENYLGKPLLFFADFHDLPSEGLMSFVDSETSHVSIDQYYAPTHTIELGDTSYQTLLFNAERDPYTGSTMEETLFKNYYQNYIQDVFNEKRRITKVKAFLPLRILLKYTLADTFIIAGKQYKINSITTNLQTGESDMELLNVV